MKNYLKTYAAEVIFWALFGQIAGAQSIFDFFGQAPGGWQERQAPKAAGKASDTYNIFWGADYSLNFLNDEFSPTEGRFNSSGTIFRNILTPMAGFRLRQDGGIVHTLTAGIDIIRDMGAHPVSADDMAAENTRLFRELTFYYGISARSGKTRINAYAGMFPRKIIGGDWPAAFFSDATVLSDRNLEGAALKLSGRRWRLMGACDWNGSRAQGRRERFMLMSKGDFSFGTLLSAGYYMTGYHFASPEEFRDVADNILAEPYLRFDLARMTRLQELSVRLGYLQGLQRLRSVSGRFDAPRGGELAVTARKWNAGISNSLFYGTSLMPYYDIPQPGGWPVYGSMLYPGDAMYKVHEDAATPWDRPGFYNRAEVFWQPRIPGPVKLRISALFHITADSCSTLRLSGTTQKLTLTYNFRLNRTAGKTRVKEAQRSQIKDSKII